MEKRKSWVFGMDFHSEGKGMGNVDKPLCGGPGAVHFPTESLGKRGAPAEETLKKVKK